MSGHSFSYRSLSISERLLSFAIRSMPIVHGKHRLLDRLAPKAWNRGESLVRVGFGCDTDLFVDVSDLVGWHLAMLRDFDPEVSTILVAAASDKTDIFWDIGANKGACFAAVSQAIPHLKVVAIEPQSSLKLINLVNLESLCKDRFEYYQVAIGSECSTMSLTVPSGNAGKASLHASAFRDGDLTETVDVITAASLFEKSAFGWPTLVKIDVEGHENAVLQSLSPAFQCRAIRALIFENHYGETQAFEVARSLAERNGYQIFGVTKSVLRTRLRGTRVQMRNVSDYAIVRDDISIVLGRFR